MNAITQLSDAKLARLVFNPLTRDEAVAEIDRRNAVKIQLAQVAIAEARKALEGFSFADLSTDELALVVRLLKPSAPAIGITDEVVPAGYAQVRNAIKVVLDAEGKNPWKSSN